MEENMSTDIQKLQAEVEALKRGSSDILSDAAVMKCI